MIVSWPNLDATNASATHYFSTLYKRASAGKIQFWSQIVVGNKILTRWGQYKTRSPQSSEETIAEGKNQGKANATTAEEQALAEGKSRYEKKLKKGYINSLEKAQAGAIDGNAIKGGLSPMLAHVWSEHSKKMTFPCFVQPKLDGHRCIAVVRDGECTLWSRTRKQITSMPHIVAAIEKLCDENELVDCAFDGELMGPGTFEETTSLIRPKELVSGGLEVIYYVYDLPEHEGTFKARNLTLQTIFGVDDNTSFDLDPALSYVQTVRVDDAIDLDHHHCGFVAQGFEGSMIRASNSIYEQGKRSFGLLKKKDFLEDDFIISGIEEGRGKLAGAAIFVCEAQNGLAFNCKLTGPTEQLRKYFQNPPIGKMLTVKFQEISGLGIPRFPVGLRVKEEV